MEEVLEPSGARTVAKHYEENLTAEKKLHYVTNVVLSDQGIFQLAFDTRDKATDIGYISLKRHAVVSVIVMLSIFTCKVPRYECTHYEAATGTISLPMTKRHVCNFKLWE